MTPAPTHAPGLHGDWLNGWLAALGITVLVDDTRLAWSDDPVPHAVVTSPGPEPLVARIAAALPATAELAALAVARNLPGVAELSRKVTREAYASRVPTARSPGDFTLAATVTDLADDGADGFLRHAPLDPPVPKGLTLWERLVDCRKAVENPAAMTAATLAGRGQRRKLNGLGFDYLRLRHAAHPIDENWVDPVVELLAFMGLAFLPVRGDGHLATARGWTRSPTRPGAFTWPLWHPPLAAIGIDGLLDRWWNRLAVPEVVTAFESVPYSKLGDSDTTVGYASRQVTSQRDSDQSSRRLGRHVPARRTVSGTPQIYGHAAEHLPGDPWIG